ncbi:DUF7521 family protein [Halorientalis marina]|jgi:hypothetical protein|uniref:DUF7521 family protein n=1 Tax=Halorientalis marina TaxID=2931976 RepID=UPI001FF22AB8|nr:hypothetical protein [Halorientalis marina]
MVPPVAVAFKTVTLVLGVVVALLAFRAYRRLGTDGLQWLAVGFGVVTLGSLLAGVADQLLDVSAHDAIVVESGLTTLGFLVITYSLYATRRASA